MREAMFEIVWRERQRSRDMMILFCKHCPWFQKTDDWQSRNHSFQTGVCCASECVHEKDLDDWYTVRDFLIDVHDMHMGWPVKKDGISRKLIAKSEPTPPEPKGREGTRLRNGDRIVWNEKTKKWSVD